MANMTAEQLQERIDAAQRVLMDASQAILIGATAVTRAQIDKALKILRYGTEA